MTLPGRSTCDKSRLSILDSSLALVVVRATRARIDSTSFFAVHRAPRARSQRTLADSRPSSIEPLSVTATFPGHIAIQPI